MKLGRAQPQPLPPKPVALPELDTAQSDPEPDWHRLFGGPEGDWDKLWVCTREDRELEWGRYAAEYEREPGDLARAYRWLDHHPAFWLFEGDGRLPVKERLHERHLVADDGVKRCVHTQVSRIRSRHRRGDTDTVRVALRAGKWPWPGEPAEQRPFEAWCENSLLSVAASSLDEAYVMLAAKVHEVYGNDRTRCGDPDPMLWRPGGE